MPFTGVSPCASRRVRPPRAGENAHRGEIAAARAIVEQLPAQERGGCPLRPPLLSVHLEQKRKHFRAGEACGGRPQLIVITLRKVGSDRCQQLGNWPLSSTTQQ